MGYFKDCFELNLNSQCKVLFFGVPFHERGGVNLIIIIAIFKHFYGAHITLTNSESDISQLKLLSL